MASGDFVFLHRIIWGGYTLIHSILKKFLMALPVLLIISFVLFLLLDALPGDAADALASMDATPEEIAAMREAMGLNQSFIVRVRRLAAGRAALGLRHIADQRHLR